MLSAGGRVVRIAACYAGKIVFRPDLLIKEHCSSSTVDLYLRVLNVGLLI